MDTLVYILFATIIIMFVIYGHSTTTPEQKEVYLVRQMYWPWWYSGSQYGYDYYNRPYPRHIPYYRHTMLDPRPLPHTPPPRPPTPIVTVAPPTNPV